MEANQTPELPGGTQPPAPSAAEPAPNPQPAQDIRLIALTISAGIAINLGVGSVLRQLLIPIPLGMLGTIAVTFLMGALPGMLSGLLTSFILAWVFSPEIIYELDAEKIFGLLQGGVVALCIGALTKYGCFRTVRRTMVAGAGVGAVTSLLFLIGLTGVRGIDGLGFLLMFLAMGTGGAEVSFECLVAFYMLKKLPANLKARYGYTG